MHTWRFRKPERSTSQDIWFDRGPLKWWASWRFSLKCHPCGTFRETPMCVFLLNCSGTYSSKQVGFPLVAFEKEPSNQGIPIPISETQPPVAIRGNTSKLRGGSGAALVISGADECTGGQGLKCRPRSIGLDCYWVGSLDFHFLVEIKGFSTKPTKSSTF